VLVFDLEYHVQVAVIEGHLDLVNSCAWHPVFNLLATACDDTGVRLLQPTM
jgi:WD40 repeat protein